MKIYKGIRQGNRAAVYVDGVALDPAPSQQLYNHSPDAFEWGYRGSGPHQLGLAILLDCFGDGEQALRHYRPFVTEFIASFSYEGFILLETQIHSWMKTRFIQEEEI
jgi:hypothetical protein